MTGQVRRQSTPEEAPVRLDKWLWAARFFKTRALATEAVKGGHVEVGGQRVKPSRHVHRGDRLIIRKGTERFEVDVLELSDRRGPATVAHTLYSETDDSLRQREDVQARRRAEAGSAPRPPEGRPNKQDRRRLRKFLGR